MRKSLLAFLDKKKYNRETMKRIISNTTKSKKKSPFIKILGQYFIVAVITFLTLGYIWKLKFPSTEAVPLYVIAQLQPANWWSTSDWMPTTIVSNLDGQSTTDDGKITINELKYFISTEETWNKVKNKSFGSLYLTIESTNRSGKWLYKNQEILIGNPLSIVINNTKVDLLISHLEFTPIINDYQSYTFKSTIYNVGKEFIENYKAGEVVIDNNNHTYLEILSVEILPAKITTTDQFGTPHLAYDPLKKDVYITAKILAKTINNTIETYDGSLLETGQEFIFNSSRLSRLTSWITSVNTTPVSE